MGWEMQPLPTHCSCSIAVALVCSPQKRISSQFWAEVEKSMKILQTVIGEVFLYRGVWGLFGLCSILRCLSLHLRQLPCSCSKEPTQTGERLLKSPIPSCVLSSPCARSGPDLQSILEFEFLSLFVYQRKPRVALHQEGNFLCCYSTQKHLFCGPCVLEGGGRTRG